MGPDLICVSIDLFSQNTLVKNKDGSEETVTRENLIVGLVEANPADGQNVKSTVTLVYKAPPWPIFEKDAVYTSDLKKKSLVALATPAAQPAATPVSSPSPAPTGLTSTPNPTPIGG